MEFNYFLFRFSSTILSKISVKSFSSERSQEDGTRDSYSPWFLNNHCCILANDAPTPIHILLHFLCRCQFRWPFLVARTQLYKPLCQSVGRSDSRSVSWYVGLSVRTSLIAWSMRLMAIGLVIEYLSKSNLDKLIFIGFISLSSELLWKFKRKCSIQGYFFNITLIASACVIIYKNFYQFLAGTKS